MLFAADFAPSSGANGSAAPQLRSIHAFSFAICSETFSRRPVFNSGVGGRQESLMTRCRHVRGENDMRAVFQPFLIVIAVVIAGFGAAEACRLGLASVSELRPVVARCCGSCHVTQSVDTDLPFWSCQQCRQYHWLNSGEIPVADRTQGHNAEPGLDGPAGVDLRKVSREPVDLAVTSGSVRGGDRRGSRAWDASRRRSPRTRAG